MKRAFKPFAALALLAMGLAPTAAHAIGTTAGTAINNQASVTYGVGPLTGLTKQSNVATVTVQQVTDVVVTQINSPIIVAPGDTGRIAIFKVTNTGNGSDTFALAAASAAGAAPAFTPTLSANPIAIDTNNNGVYDPGTDLYATATTAIPADSYATVFVFNDIPTTALDGQKGNTTLTATSNTANGAPGTLIAGAGVGGVNAVVGGNGGTGNATSTYRVSNAVVNIAKTSAIISDPYTAPGGTPQAIPGAVIRYTLTVTVAGTNTAKNIVLSDPIPANTTYVPNSTKLDGVAQADATVYTPPAGANPGKITINLGNMTSANTHTVVFDVTIN